MLFTEQMDCPLTPSALFFTVPNQSSQQLCSKAGIVMESVECFLGMSHRRNVLTDFCKLFIENSDC